MLGLSFAAGVDLGTPSGTRASVSSDTTNEIRNTYNVTAETKKGNADRVIMAGAHLDSVIEGPGINDNGSGSAAVLEMAQELAKEKKLRNQVRFAWWGAEELGLLGAEHYVADLAENDKSDAGRDRCLPELRHGRVAELRALRLRRGQLHRRGRGRVRQAPATSSSCSPATSPTSA